jgi:hypothetical protein
VLGLGFGVWGLGFRFMCYFEALVARVRTCVERDLRVFCVARAAGCVGSREISFYIGVYRVARA